jgi:hypothetical protein
MLSQNLLPRILSTYRQTTRWTSCRMTVVRPTTFVTVSGQNFVHPIQYQDDIPDWSNFEIADLDFWRSEAYSKFFDYFESKGGFYYEVHAASASRVDWLILFLQRWGDAPVHSIAASLFARKDQVHFFSDIGYRHSAFQHCPEGDDWSKGRCSCDPSDSFGAFRYLSPFAVKRH